jgi:hypothetical protein
MGCSPADVKRFAAALRRNTNRMFRQVTPESSDAELRELWRAHSVRNAALWERVRAAGCDKAVRREIARPFERACKRTLQDIERRQRGRS